MNTGRVQGETVFGACDRAGTEELGRRSQHLSRMGSHRRKWMRVVYAEVRSHVANTENFKIV